MILTVTGRVIGIVEDYKALLLLLEERDGMKVNTVAVRCWANSLKQRAQDFAPGDLVEAHGKLSSRESKGRWYTGFEGEGLRLVEGTTKPAEAAKPLDDDDIPFG